jgi:hypothetical protein
MNMGNVVLGVSSGGQEVGPARREEEHENRGL